MMKLRLELLRVPSSKFLLYVSSNFTSKRDLTDFDLNFSLVIAGLDANFSIIRY